MMRELSIKAVLIGFAVDFAFTTYEGAMLAVNAAILTGLTSRNSSHFDLAAYNDLISSGPFQVMSLVVGCLGTVFGAALTGRIAPTYSMKNAYALSVVECVFGLFYVFRGATTPLWYQALGIILSTLLPIWGMSLSSTLFGGKPSQKAT